MYFRDLIPRLVKEGDDSNYGSTAVCDTICLQVCIQNFLNHVNISLAKRSSFPISFFRSSQALSKRIHYGKYVAEAKFRESPDAYEDAIRKQVNLLLLLYITWFWC